MSVTDEQHKALSTLYVRFCQKKKKTTWALLLTLVANGQKKSQKKSRKAHDKNKQY